MLRVKKCFHTLIFGLASNPKSVRNEIRDIMYMGKNMENKKTHYWKFLRFLFNPFSLCLFSQNNVWKRLNNKIYENLLSVCLKVSCENPFFLQNGWSILKKSTEIQYGVVAVGSARHIYGSILLQTALNMSTQAHRKFIRKLTCRKCTFKIIYNFYNKLFF